MIIHAAWIFPSGHAAELLSKKFNIPFIVTLMGSDVNHIRLNTLRHRLAKRVVETANKVTSVSQVLIEELIKKNVLPASKTTTLTHTVYNFSKFNLIDKESVKSELGIDKKIKIIFFAGMLRKLKNADILIRSTSVLLKENYDLNLILAGSGYEKENLYRLAEKVNILKYVKFLGNIDEDLLVKYYNAADVFCLPSRNEGLPNVIVEALLCGTPVVATKVGEIPRIIRDAENGYLVETNSAQSLAKGLQNALERQWDRKFLRKSVSFLSVDNVISEYKKVYEEVRTQS